MRRVVCVFALVPTLSCSALSGLDDFFVGGEVSVGGAAGAAGAAGVGGGTGATGSVGGGGEAPSVGGGGAAGCVDGDLGTDPFAGAREVPLLNTGSDEDDPTFSADGLVLVFNSDRTGAGDLYGSMRASIDDDWNAPTIIAELNTGAVETNPVLAPDGLTIWFHRNPPGGMFVSRRSSRMAPWPMAVAEPFSDPLAAVCAVTEDMLTMILHSDTGFPQNRIREAQRASTMDGWAMLDLVAELDDGRNNQEAWLSPCEGRHIYWGRDGIWRATRPDRNAQFVGLKEVTDLTVLGDTADPWLSGDQSYIMFAMGMGPMRDIWEARR